MPADRDRLPRVGLLRWRGGVVTLALVLAGLALGSPAASAQSAADFTDWTSALSSVARGTLHGASISLSGNVQTGPGNSDTSGGFTGFNDPAFTPPLPTSDAILIGTGTPFTLQFGSPAANPVMDVGSLGGTLHFPSGTHLTKVSGDLSVSGSDVIGHAGSPAAKGTFRLDGTFSSTSFEIQEPCTCGESFYIQVGADPPPPPPPPPPTPSSCPAGTSPGVACEMSGGVTTITGTSGDDTIVATGGPDVIRGGAGNDKLNCRGAQKATVCQGDAGKDSVDCSKGAARCTGGSGNDTVNCQLAKKQAVCQGDSGKDRVDCSKGAARCTGGTGNDTVNCQLAKTQTVCQGGSGQDRVDCSKGAARCTGGSGNDTVNCQLAKKQAACQGDSGKDRLNCSMGAATCLGGSGKDTVICAHGAARCVGEVRAAIAWSAVPAWPAAWAGRGDA
jgi:Ca2+-binding RTX toxin-like protein